MARFTFIILFLGWLGASASAEPSNPQALGPWSQNPSWIGSFDVNAYPSLEINCADQNLYPTHPSQNLKRYHVWQSAHYSEDKLKATDYECLTPSPTKKLCLRGDNLMHVVLSDVYQDSCGHFYRGFMERNYLMKNEAMGTLITQGRTMYPDPNGALPGDMIEGGTWSPLKSEFIKLGALFPNDLEVIRLSKAAAAKKFKYDGKLYYQK